MRYASIARRIGLSAALITAFMLAAAPGAQAQVCEGFDCGEGELFSGPQVQYTFSTFSLCTDCLTTGVVRTAYIGAAEYPPTPAHPPHPVIALAQGKLLVAGDNGADQILAIGRIYQDGARYLFDGHLVPGAHYPPGPAIGDFIFQGVFFERGLAELVISQSRSSQQPGCHADAVSCPFALAITVTNMGRSAAEHVVVTDSNATSTPVSRTATTSGTCQAPSGGSVSCTLGSVAAGATAKIAVELETGCLGGGVGITSTATVTSHTGERTTDNNTSVFSNRCGSTRGGGGGGDPG